MKSQDRKYWKRVLVLIALIVPLSTTGTVFGNGGVGLDIFMPDLTARWWQWVFSIPSSVHPLTFKETDPTGANYCMVGQQGREWFLGGIFKVVDVSPASKKVQSEGQGEITPVEVERECEIPFGKAILIPVLNAECNTAEELALGNDVPQALLGKIRYLRKCAKTVADAVDRDTATAFFGPVDSEGNWDPRPVPVKRVKTILPFSVVYSPDNILSNNCPGGFLCEPDPNPSLAQADGYWAHVLPRKPGTYKLQTFGEAPGFDFALRITYTLKIVGPKEQ